MLLAEYPCEDSSNNGLQVEGCDEVQRVAFAVDGCLEVFEQAVEAGADFLIVHHGISWGPGFRTLTGTTAARFRTLFCNGLSLYGVHLPLDAHADVGNNAMLARALGLHGRQTFAEYHGIEIGYHGTLPVPMSLDEFAGLVAETVGGEPVVVNAGPETIVNIGIVSGGGADAIPETARLGLDCLLTGEIAHQNIHTAREYGVNVVAAGHYLTETWGVRAVMECVKENFPSVDCVFLDVPTGF
jgi:dinuclear metal center YbgI/SA1388 family protein